METSILQNIILDNVKIKVLGVKVKKKLNKIINNVTYIILWNILQKSKFNNFFSWVSDIRYFKFFVFHIF